MAQSSHVSQQPLHRRAGQVGHAQRGVPGEPVLHGMGVAQAGYEPPLEGKGPVVPAKHRRQLGPPQGHPLQGGSVAAGPVEAVQ
ncbi:MAG: hypothetical protein ABEK42_14525, partial [Thiohalorhabdaceae bacterium]